MRPDKKKGTLSYDSENQEKFTEKTRYVITSAQSKAPQHKNFMRGLEHFVKEFDAELVILPMIGKSAKEDWDDIDPAFYEHDVEFSKRKLNNNIQLQQFHVRPYQIDPITGLSRFAQRETTQIFASPKQRLRSIPHSVTKLPKFLATTGACTKPNYATGNDVSAERRRLGSIAKRDHVYGAMIVEIEDAERFYMRNIRADKGGKFVDLGNKYDGSDIEGSQLESIVFGDWHPGYTDPKVRDGNFDMIDAI